MPGSLVFADLPRIGPLLARGAVTASGRLGANGTIPERVARVARHRQDVDRLAGYARVCGFTLRDAVPATWLHVLTFGLQIALMAERDFPFALPGLVHTTNTMSLLAPVTVADDLDLLVHAGNARRHAKGTEFDLVGEVRVGGRLAWTGTSTYLARGTGAAPAASGAPGSDVSGTLQPAPAEPGPALRVEGEVGPAFDVRKVGERCAGALHVGEGVVTFRGPRLVGREVERRRGARPRQALFDEALPDRAEREPGERG